MESLKKNRFLKFSAIFLAFLFAASLLQSQAGTNPGSEFKLFLRAFNNTSDSLYTNVGSNLKAKNSISQDSTEDTFTIGLAKPATQLLITNEGAVPLFVACDIGVTSGSNEILIPAKVSLALPMRCTVLHAVTGIGGSTTFDYIAWF